MRALLWMVVGTVAAAGAVGPITDPSKTELNRIAAPPPPAFTFDEPPLARMPVGPIEPNVPSTYDW